ncbi:MAG TPA: Ger(x)C family spore germination protein [Clostridiaceae bacterium]|nr:Ger(x)C family spore germination protein [Clostridiaceae bacterium]
MKKKMNILIKKSVLCFLMLFMLSGCLGGREINDLEIVIGMGVDKDENTENILVTAQIVKVGEIEKTSGSSGGGPENKAFWNVSHTGNSIFEAVRQITHKTGNRLFVSHNQAVIFGKDIALEDVQKYIDFFLRAHEMRPTALILIAENRASDVMDAKPETEILPAMNIAKLVKAYGFTSHFYKVNVKDFASCIMSATSAPIAPIVGISKDNGSKDIYVSGMAVFKNAKMVGELNQLETRGLLWVLGEVKSGVILVPSPNRQGNAVLEILKTRSKVTPEINNGKIVMNIKIKMESSLSEQTTTENLATIPAFEEIQKALEEIIRQEIMTAFDKSRELNADIFGFGEILHKKYNNVWKTIKDDWDEVYPTIKLNIEVEARIQKTDLLKKPATSNKKGK